MSIEDAIAEAIATSSTPPQNESATCHWVIYPLLLACGYVHQEIVPEKSDNQGQYPDYTILPNETCCWYLEAKAWNIALQDTHAQQAMTYAFHNGKRWVVLSNGRIWRLYDSSIQGLATDRLVAEAKLSDPESLTPLLRALSKDSVKSGGLDHYAVRSRLCSVLATQLADEQSDTIRSIWKILKSMPGLGSTSKKDIVSYFQLPAISQVESSKIPLVNPESLPIPAVLVSNSHKATISELFTGGAAKINFQTPILLQ